MVKVTNIQSYLNIYIGNAHNFREELESCWTRTKSVIDQEEPEKEEENPLEDVS